MKTKLTAILVILLSSFAFSSCAEEEVLPSTDPGCEICPQGVGEDDPDF